MRVLRFAGVHLWTDVLAAHGRMLQRSTAVEEGHHCHQAGDPEATAAREPDAVAGGGESPESHRAGLGGVPAVSRGGGIWGAVRCGSGSPSATRAPRMPPVKSVREPDDRNGHVRFDERGRETERWTSRSEWPRKTSLAAGAAGPVRHRAHPRLYQWSHEISVAGRLTPPGAPAA